MADPLAPANPVDAYKSPYTSSVIDSALKNLNDVGQQRRNQLGTEAFQSGAYGDARHGVEDANLTTGLARASGDLSSQLNSDAFDKAMGWLNTDVDRQTNTAIANANLDNQWFSNQLAAMGLGNSISSNAITQGQSLSNALLGLDTYDKNQQQTTDNLNYADWQDMQNWDANKLSQFLGFIAGAPTASSTTSNTSRTTPDNSWASLIGSSLSNIFKQ